MSNQFQELVELATKGVLDLRGEIKADPDPLTSDQRKELTRVANVSDDVMMTINEGIRGIAALLVNITGHGNLKELASYDLARVGFLLEGLSQANESLRHSQSSFLDALDRRLK